MRAHWGILLGLVAGCGSTESFEAEVADDELRLVEPKVSLTIRESHQTYFSEPESFQLTARGVSLACKDDVFYLVGEKSLYDEPWKGSDPKSFFGGQNPSLQDYAIASCRDAETSARGWFAKDLKLSVSDVLRGEQYNPARAPLLFQVRSLASKKESYISCSTRERVVLDGTETHTRYRVDMTCRSMRKPTAKGTALLDFLDASGPAAALQSYRVWPHPQAPSTRAAWEQAKAALLQNVQPGTYIGAMSTLGKTCHVRIDAPSPSKLVVEHTIDSNNQTRHLEVSEQNFLGTLSGELYQDLLAVGEEPVGTFTSIEVRGEKGKTFGIRFDKNDTLEGQVVRINGSETYCRRLTKTP